MATYDVTENAAEATIGSTIYTGWGTVDGGFLPDEQLGAELPVTVGAYTIQLVYAYKDATSPPEPGNEFGWRYGIVLTGDHTGGSDFFPEDFLWQDTNNFYHSGSVTELNGWTRVYDATNNLTGWLGPVTLDYPTTYTGYEDATNYSVSPTITTPLPESAMANNVFTNQTADVTSSVYNATGPIRLTFSGTWDGAYLHIWSRTSSNTGYDGVRISDDIPRPRVALVSGDSYYYTLTNCGDDTDISLDDVPE